MNLEVPKSTIQEVLNCNFSSWYEHFKDITIPSVLLPLPKNVEEYLNADGLVLPQDSSIGIHIQDDVGIHVADEVVDCDEDTWSEQGGEEGEELCEPQPDFPEFKCRVAECISLLGGEVFPKLNWSSPKDASWIAFGNTLKCTCLNDILLLLKSSSFIMHDLNDAFSLCSDAHTSSQVIEFSLSLVLRKWESISPSGEFRCFVSNDELFAICQRESKTYYSYVERNKENIPEQIMTFFEENVQDVFPSSSYVFDVYRKNEHTYWLIDFGPFSEVTDTLLFTWDELINYTQTYSEDSFPVFRYVTCSAGLIQSSEYRQYSYPVEVNCLSSISQHGQNVLQDLVNLNLSGLQNIPTDTDESGPDVHR